MHWLSVVMPVRNEAEGIAQVLAPLQALRDQLEIIVVDGGSEDDTAALAAPLADKVLASAPGRARQMNAGAAAATGEVLLFLHADTQLPEGFVGMIRAVIPAPPTVSPAPPYVIPAKAGIQTVRVASAVLCGHPRIRIYRRSEPQAIRFAYSACLIRSASTREPSAVGWMPSLRM